MRKGQWKDGKPLPAVVVKHCCQECRVKEERIKHLKTFTRSFISLAAEFDNLAKKSDLDRILKFVEEI